MLSTVLGAEHTLPGERCSVLAPALWERAHGQNAAWPCRAGCTGAQEEGGRVVAAGGGELTQCWGAAVSVIRGCVTSHPEMWRLKQQFLGVTPGLAPPGPPLQRLAFPQLPSGCHQGGSPRKAGRGTALLPAHAVVGGVQLLDGCWKQGLRLCWLLARGCLRTLSVGLAIVSVCVVTASEGQTPLPVEASVFRSRITTVTAPPPPPLPCAPAENRGAGHIRGLGVAGPESQDVEILGTILEVTCSARSALWSPGNGGRAARRRVWPGCGVSRQAPAPGECLFTCTVSVWLADGSSCSTAFQAFTNCVTIGISSF